MVSEWNEKLMEEIEVDGKSVVKAVAEKGLMVWQDSYGDGVALINNKSFATYHELAKEFGIDILDHQKSEESEKFEKIECPSCGLEFENLELGNETQCPNDECLQIIEFE